jgi:hemerythrin superfamily protein
MGTMINTGSDVVAFLKGQHEEIKALFNQVDATEDDERAEAFFALRRLLAVHETAEEEIVHPVARRVLPDGQAVVATRLREENEAKKVLSSLESLELDSAEFDTQFAMFAASVIAHAESEEREEFERLADHLDQRQLEAMRKAVKLAESIAPTRPHAGVESGLANALVGPFASMLDRARDALTGKTS